MNKPEIRQKVKEIIIDEIIEDEKFRNALRRLLK
jgi:hypothetical protein